MSGQGVCAGRGSAAAASGQTRRVVSHGQNSKISK